MATTKYEIFCKYYHSIVNKVVNNDNNLHPWQQAEDWNDKRNENIETIKGAKKMAEDLPGIEHCWIRPEDDLEITNDKQRAEARRAAVELDNDLATISTIELNHDNPKYDMVFVYDGLISDKGMIALNQDKTDPRETIIPIVYYERMKRLKMTPWFLYATCSSLNAAMTKAGELVNIVGKDNVIIGKVVSLDQYIEIV